VIVPGAARAALDDLLQPGEHIIWTGRPDPVATFRAQLLWWWLGVPLLVMTIGLRHADLISADVSFFPMMIAAVFLAAPFVMVLYACGTLYALTDRRVIIRHDTVRTTRQVAWYSLTALDSEFEILNSGDTVGDLYFLSGTRGHPDADYAGKVALRALRHPQQVAGLIEKARKSL
jgi:hypothetical protein